MADLEHQPDAQSPYLNVSATTSASSTSTVQASDPPAAATSPLAPVSVPSDATAPASSSAYRNPDQQPSAPIAPAAAAPPPAPFPWVEEAQPSDFKLKQMDPQFRGEHLDATCVRGVATSLKQEVAAEQPTAAPITSISTHYMNDAERDKAKIGVQGGKILDSSGNKLDTTAASGTGTLGTEGANKHLFVMTATGDICQADPWANKRVGEKDGEKEGHAAFINHSSFKRGMAVAGAGEMRVEDGELQQISDQSGHYKPDGEMVAQTLDQLGAKGVNMDKTSLKLVDKENSGDGPVYCSPAQFKTHDPAKAEDEIRTEKLRLKNQLTKAVRARRASPAI